MQEIETSNFRFYSVGRVAANKKRGSFIIEAVPVETVPNLSGEITDHEGKLPAKVPSVDGSDAKDLDLSTTTSVQAEWLPWGQTNRVTAPDVRRGEWVLLFKYADADVIYWTEFKAEHILRRLETVTWIFSNEREENKPLTEDNVYMVTVSTHDKHITISTTKSDGEPFAYRLQLNTKEGFFTLEDDDGNYFFLNSKERHLKLRNKDESFIELNKRVINITSQDEINLKTKRYSLIANESLKEETREHTYKSANFTGNTSGTYKLSAQSYQGTATFTYNGNTTFNGNTRTNGSGHVTGNHYEGSSSGPGNSR